jgi:coproporphyrinogen III oxidase-like Fe-S oxidoreductase
MVLPSIHQKIKDGRLPKPLSAEDRFRMFYEVRQFLSKRFEATNIYSYGNEFAKPCRFMFELVYGSYHNEYIGVGCSAYSSFKGLMFQNDPSEFGYIKSVEAGASAVKSASIGAAYEKSLVFFPKHTKLSLSEYRSLRLDCIYEHKLNYLEDNGFITSDLSRDEIKLTDKGELHYASLMVF